MVILFLSMGIFSRKRMAGCLVESDMAMAFHGYASNVYIEALPTHNLWILKFDYNVIIIQQQGIYQSIGYKDMLR